MSVAWGAECDQSAELGSIAEARDLPDGSWRIRIAYYLPLHGMARVAAGLYEAEPETAGFFLDPMPSAPVLEDLARVVLVHRLEAVDVAAASAQFRSALKGRRVTAEEHPALEQALTFALQRPLAAAFGFERRKVACDMSPLNAAAFALWGLRQSAEAEPGAWVI